MVSGTWNHNFINYRLVCGSIPLQTMVNWDHDHWISQVGKAARNTTNQQPYLNIFLVFCQQCAGNPSANGNFFRFQSQKRSQSKNEDQEKNGPWLLSSYFDTDLPENNRSRSLDKAEESEKIQKDPEGTNSITILCHCSFQHNHENRVYLQTYPNLQNGRLYIQQA